LPSEDYFGVSLRVSHDMCSPSEISKALGREAEYTGVKGTPRGRFRGPPPPSASTWRNHYWCSAFNEGETPEARVGAIANFLLEREDEMMALLRSGGRADVYVFIGSDATVALEFDGPALAVLGRLGVTLGIEVMSGNPLRDDELAEMSTRCDGATPPPWRSFVEGREHTSGSSFIKRGEGAVLHEDIELTGATVADQDFIAHARQDVPRLVSEVLRLRCILTDRSDS
jgi:hypothetical protein